LGAFVLGAAHAIQPGHGKTIVAASSLGPDFGPIRGALLGLATATAHMASVALIAAALWATRSAQRAEIHVALSHIAGFVIAAIGFWRLGRHLAGFGEHRHDRTTSRSDVRGIIPLALAGGAVPCWDAVALVIISEAIGKLPLGLILLGAFSLGMATVLVAVGLIASRFRSAFEKSGTGGGWERRLGIISGLILATIGLSLLRT
jgi:nickel/cobalt exporter